MNKILPKISTLLRWLKFSAIFLRPLVPLPSIDIHRKFYGARPIGTSPTGVLNARGAAKYSDFGPIQGYISETCKIGRKLVLGLITNRKLHTIFRLVPKSVTLNDLERRNGRYFALFQ